MMAGIIVSTIAFFIASFFIKRYLNDMGIPKGMARNATVFALALAVSYGVQVAVQWIMHVA